MANTKISNLPSTTASTINDFMVKNDSGETTTSKVQLKDFLGLTRGTGSNSLKSASFLTTTAAQSTGIGSIAIGNDTEALADKTIAIGDLAECFDSIRVNSTAIGSPSRVAQYSTAIGSDSGAVGANATALGYFARANDNNAIAIGSDATCFGQGGIAIGYDSLTQTTAGAGVSIGREAISSGATSVALGPFAEANALNSVAIGNGIVASHARSVCLNENSLFSATTHTQSLYIDNNFSTKVASLFDLSSFTIDLNQSPTWEVRLDQNATMNFINVRSGGRYILFIENTGAFDFTSVTATGFTLKFSGGSRSVLTASSTDIYEIYVLGTFLMVNQLQNFA